MAVGLSLSARLLLRATVLMFLLHLIAMLADGDFRSVQGAGGLFGLPRLGAPFALLAAYLLCLAPLRHATARSPRFAVLKYGAILPILLAFIALLWPPDRHPLVAGMLASAFWLGIGLGIQPLHFNRWLGRSRWMRMGTTLFVSFSLSSCWLVHYGVFEIVRSSAVGRLEDARTATRSQEYELALDAVGHMHERCPIPKRRIEATALVHEIRDLRQTTTVTEARRMMAGGRLDDALERVDGFLAVEDGVAYRVDAVPLRVEIRERIGDRLLMLAAAAEDRGSFDEALDLTRDLVRDHGDHPRYPEALTEEGRREDLAAEACAQRIRRSMKEGHPEIGLESARDAKGRYPDAYADSDLPDLRVDAADAVVRKELALAEDHEDAERYDDALAVLREVKRSVPETTIAATIARDIREILDIGEDSSEIWSRSYFVRHHNAHYWIGKSAQTVEDAFPDLTLRDPSEKELKYKLFPLCRTIELEGKELYFTCFVIWQERVLEVYVRFTASVDMDGVVRETMNAYGPTEQPGGTYVWTLSGHRSIHISPAKQLLRYTDPKEQNKFDRWKRRQ